MSRKKITITIDPAVWDWITKYSKETRIPKAQIIELSVIDKINKVQEEESEKKNRV
jgi:hypothetical protein